MRRRWAVIVAGAAVLILAAVAAFAIRSQMAPSAAGGAGASCSPRPCADAGGYRMDVRSVERGGGIVRLQVSFRVSGRSHMHAQPSDFSLSQDGQTYRPYFDAGAGCAQWPRTQIPDGTSLGPRVTCFKPSDTAGRLTLNWNPDLGLSEYFSSGYDLTL